MASIETLTPAKAIERGQLLVDNPAMHFDPKATRSIIVGLLDAVALEKRRTKAAMQVTGKTAHE